MRAVATILIAAPLTIAAISVWAQETLPHPVKPLDQPVSMSYRDVDAASFDGNMTFSLFKQGQRTQTQSLTYEGTMSSRTVGSDVEVSFEGNFGTTQTQRVLCLLRRTGEVLKCTPEANFRFPVYDRESYKLGDMVTIPFIEIGGVVRPLNGKVRGTAAIGQRQALAIDFAEHRTEKVGTTDVVFDVTGYAYMDIATGYPMEIEASAEVIGALSPDLDRVEMRMKQKYEYPAAQ